MNYCVLFYLAVINLIAVMLTVRDKNAARKNTWRVKERTLLAVSVLGGSVAMLLTMLAVRHKTRHAKFMVGIPLIILIQAAFFVFVFDDNLSVSRYIMETDKLSGQVKLILVADLHSCDYGAEQSSLLNAIDAEQPDAVLLCGDIFDDILTPDKAIEFIEGVSPKYPCYYVSGNHEFRSGRADAFKDILASREVKVLEGANDILELHGDRIMICGTDDPDTDKYPSRSAPYAEQTAGIRAAGDTGLFTIIMSHRPERIDEFLPLDADIVLSGHAHGGQWRIPVILENGLLSPNQGLFPEYTNGEYFFGNTTLIVSRGLARESTMVPRVFNRPEIVVVTLEGESR